MGASETVEAMTTDKVHSVRLQFISPLDSQRTQFSFAFMYGNDVDIVVNITVPHTEDVELDKLAQYARKRLRNSLMAVGGHMSMAPEG